MSLKSYPLSRYPLQAEHAFLERPISWCRPEDPPSASDVAIDSICEYALEGYGRAANKYQDPEIASEKDRKRRVRKAKAKMQDNHRRRL